MGRKDRRMGGKERGEQVKTFWRGEEHWRRGVFWEGAKGGGVFWKGAKGSCQERKKGFFLFFCSGPEARGELEMGGFGRWKS